MKSTTTKSFIVTNDLRQHIRVYLELGGLPELEKSTPRSQIIPPGQEAGFDLVFRSEEKKQFKGVVSYFVNDTQFKFLVSANAEPVVLDVQKKALKFQFADDNMDMSISEIVTITNNGNATAKYRWNYNSSGTGLFIPSPVEDEIPAKSSKTAKITFTPNGPKPDEEILTLKIEDGNNVDVRCNGIVNDAKCVFMEKMLDFGNVPVGIKSKDEIIQIKN